MFMNWLTTPWSWTSPSDLAVMASVPVLASAGLYCLYRAGLVLVGTGKHRAL